MKNYPSNIKMYFTNVLMIRDHDGHNAKYYEVTCEKERTQQNYQICIGEEIKFELPPELVETTSLKDLISMYVSLAEKKFNGDFVNLFDAVKIVDSNNNNRLFTYEIEEPFQTSVTLLREVIDNQLVALQPTFIPICVHKSHAIYKSLQDNNIEVADVE